MYWDRRDQSAKFPQETQSAIRLAKIAAEKRGFPDKIVPAELFAASLLTDPDLTQACSPFGLSGEVFETFTPPPNKFRKIESPESWLDQSAKLFPDLGPANMVPSLAFLTLLRIEDSGVRAIVQFCTSLQRDNDVFTVDSAVSELVGKQIREGRAETPDSLFQRMARHLSVTKWMSQDRVAGDRKAICIS